jgi:hypothetical protein
MKTTVGVYVCGIYFDCSVKALVKLWLLKATRFTAEHSQIVGRFEEAIRGDFNV